MLIAPFPVKGQERRERKKGLPPGRPLFLGDGFVGVIDTFLYKLNLGVLFDASLRTDLLAFSQAL